MPNDQTILEALREIYREKLEGEPEDVGLDARLVEELGLDSIRLLTLVVEVEDRFRISLDEQDEAEIRTVADLVAIVRSKTQNGKAQIDSQDPA